MITSEKKPQIMRLMSQMQLQNHGEQHCRRKFLLTRKITTDMELALFLLKVKEVRHKDYFSLLVF